MSGVDRMFKSSDSVFKHITDRLNPLRKSVEFDILFLRPPSGVRFACIHDSSGAMKMRNSRTQKLDHLHSTIQEAEKAAFPNKTISKLKNNTVIWTPAIKEAAGKMKATTRKWKIAGSPLEPSK